MSRTERLRQPAFPPRSLLLLRDPSVDLPPCLAVGSGSCPRHGWGWGNVGGGEGGCSVKPEPPQSGGYYSAAVPPFQLGAAWPGFRLCSTDLLLSTRGGEGGGGGCPTGLGCCGPALPCPALPCLQACSILTLSGVEKRKVRQVLPLLLLLLRYAMRRKKLVRSGTCRRFPFFGMG